MRSLILTGLMSLMMIFPNVKESKLTDLTKPYLGEYECKSAQLGSKDCLERFSYIRLELKDEGTFTLRYKEEKAKEGQMEGSYHYNKERGVLTLTSKSGGFKREFSLNNGLLTVSLPIGEKNLVLQFEQK